MMRGPLTYCALDFSGAPAGPSRRPLAPLSGAALTPLAGGRQSYVQATGAQQTNFVPFYAVENESYDVYFQRG